MPTPISYGQKGQNGQVEGNKTLKPELRGYREPPKDKAMESKVIFPPTNHI